MAKEKSKMIKLATAFHPHGLKGEVELRLLNTDHEESVLNEGMMVLVTPFNEKSQLPKDGQEWKILKLSFGNKVRCVFEGIKDRTHLESFLPFDIQVSREMFPEPENDEVYLVDLVDLDVVSPEGVKLGTLESFSDNGHQYLFDVRLEDGTLITVPYVDVFFPEINMEDKQIVMIMPEFTE